MKLPPADIKKLNAFVDTQPDGRFEQLLDRVLRGQTTPAEVAKEVGVDPGLITSLAREQQQSELLGTTQKLSVRWAVEDGGVGAGGTLRAMGFFDNSNLEAVPSAAKIIEPAQHESFLQRAEHTADNITGFFKHFLKNPASIATLVLGALLPVISPPTIPLMVVAAKIFGGTAIASLLSAAGLKIAAATERGVVGAEATKQVGKSEAEKIRSTFEKSEGIAKAVIGDVVERLVFINRDIEPDAKPILEKITRDFHAMPAELRRASGLATRFLSELGKVATDDRGADDAVWVLNDALDEAKTPAEKSMIRVVARDVLFEGMHKPRFAMSNDANLKLWDMVDLPRTDADHAALLFSATELFVQRESHGGEQLTEGEAHDLLQRLDAHFPTAKVENQIRNRLFNGTVPRVKMDEDTRTMLWDRLGPIGAGTQEPRKGV